MRAAPALLVAFVVVLGAWACGTDPVDSAPPEDGQDASRIDLAYCTRYCDAQANAGTLAGTRTECVRKCCGTGRPDCVVPDGGLAPLRDGGDVPVIPDGSTCARPCGDTCCQEGQACHSEAAGPPTCPPACTEGKDCATGCCAPATNTKGEPVGPYVCKANDGKPYHCCNGAFNFCDGVSGISFCCVGDAKKNNFCTRPCQNKAQCGEASCVGYDFGFTTCGGPTGCGP